MTDIAFDSAKMLLVNPGQDSENYRFQVTINKAVHTNINGQDATCYFNATTFTGYLYTKAAKQYPADGQALPAGGNSTWPFAMRFEEVAAGGQNVPDCYAVDGQSISGIQAADGGSLCDCLYRNWHTPLPT
jgi:hypothetical protein